MEIGGQRKCFEAVYLFGQLHDDSLLLIKFLRKILLYYLMSIKVDLHSFLHFIIHEFKVGLLCNQFLYIFFHLGADIYA